MKEKQEEEVNMPFLSLVHIPQGTRTSPSSQQP